MELRIFAGPGPRFPSVPVELLGFVIDTLGSLLLYYGTISDREGQYRGLLFENRRFDMFDVKIHVLYFFCVKITSILLV